MDAKSNCGASNTRLRSENTRYVLTALGGRPV